MDFNFLKIIEKGTKAVPATKYGVGILGLVAIVALIKQFNVDLNIAVWGTVVVLALMSILVIFAKLAQTSASEFRNPVKIFMWFTIILYIASCALLFTASFFGWPQLHSLSKQHELDTTKNLINIKAHNDTVVGQKNKISDTDIKIIHSPESNVIIGNGNNVKNK